MTSEGELFVHSNWFRVPAHFHDIRKNQEIETSFPSPLFLTCLHAHAPKNAPPNAEALYFTGIEPRRS